MKCMWVAAVAAAFLPSCAVAQSNSVKWAQFVDPAENAFSIDAPQGWNVTGGTMRLAPYIAEARLTATSPDGGIQILIGDPSIPAFNAPMGNQPEGQAVQLSPMLPPAVVLNYRPGAAFARFYGPSALANSGCAAAAPAGAQEMPELGVATYKRAVEVTRGVATQFPVSTPRHDAGLATFTCRNGGGSMVAGVIAVTTSPMPSWGAWVAVYIAPPGQEAWALAILNHMLASRQWNPEWDQAMRLAAGDALRQQAAENQQFMAMLQERSWAFTNAVVAMGQASQDARTRAHYALMDQMARQSAIHNENFRRYMYQRSLSAWRFNAHIRNGELYRDVNTGEIIEIDR